jgi:hypothetical protein
MQRKISGSAEISPLRFAISTKMNCQCSRLRKMMAPRNRGSCAHQSFGAAQAQGCSGGDVASLATVSARLETFFYSKGGGVLARPFRAGFECFWSLQYHRHNATLASYHSWPTCSQIRSMNEVLMTMSS